MHAITCTELSKSPATTRSAIPRLSPLRTVACATAPRGARASTTAESCKLYARPSTSILVLFEFVPGVFAQGASFMPKAPCPTSTTPSMPVIESSELQPLKAYSGTWAAPAGHANEVRPVQSYILVSV